MKLAKAFAIVVSAGLLSVATFGSPRDLYAQDGSETDQGAWSAPDGGSADQSSPDAKKTHPLNIKGCWSGSVTDTGDGTGTAMFVFHQNGNHKKIIIGTTFMFQWADSAMARGPLKGSVTATGFTRQRQCRDNLSDHRKRHRQCYRLDGGIHLHRRLRVDLSGCDVLDHARLQLEIARTFKFRAQTIARNFVI